MADCLDDRLNRSQPICAGLSLPQGLLMALEELSPVYSYGQICKGDGSCAIGQLQGDRQISPHFGGRI